MSSKKPQNGPPNGSFQARLRAALADICNFGQAPQERILKGILHVRGLGNTSTKIEPAHRRPSQASWNWLQLGVQNEPFLEVQTGSSQVRLRAALAEICDFGRGLQERIYEGILHVRVLGKTCAKVEPEHRRSSQAADASVADEPSKTLFLFIQRKNKAKKQKSKGFASNQE